MWSERNLKNWSERSGKAQFTWSYPSFLLSPARLPLYSQGSRTADLLCAQLASGKMDQSSRLCLLHSDLCFSAFTVFYVPPLGRFCAIVEFICNFKIGSLILLKYVYFKSVSITVTNRKPIPRAIHRQEPSKRGQWERSKGLKPQLDTVTAPWFAGDLPSVKAVSTDRGFPARRRAAGARSSPWLSH